MYHNTPIHQSLVIIMIDSEFEKNYHLSFTCKLI